MEFDFKPDYSIILEGTLGKSLKFRSILHALATQESVGSTITHEDEFYRHFYESALKICHVLRGIMQVRVFKKGSFDKNGIYRNKIHRVSAGKLAIFRPGCIHQILSRSSFEAKVVLSGKKTGEEGQIVQLENSPHWHRLSELDQNERRKISNWPV